MNPATAEFFLKLFAYFNTSTVVMNLIILVGNIIIASSIRRRDKDG